MIREIAFALLLLLSLSVDAAAISLNRAGVTTLSDGLVKVTLGLESGRTTGPCPSAGSWRWGSEQVCPEQRISSLEVRYQRQAVFIPYSAFADLGNPSSVAIERGSSGGTYSIKIVGGEAATSYVSVLKFKGGLLLEKVVRHGEFPASAWEKTLYKFNVMQLSLAEPFRRR